MYTPQRLMEIALEADTRYQELSKQYPLGTFNKERNDAYDLSEIAMICAAWMEKNGLSEVKSIGPFNEFLPTSGSLVKVKEGATVYSTHPSYTREGRKVRRDQVIKVHDVYQGYVDRYHHIDHPEVRNATVHWVGSGGYWKWCDINDVEQVEQV